ncbi:hypothetical protein AXF42_Ash000682 [Apostasia shenzhenica]|uniref:Uncharacterized protein n=1 Tax=Apostasia shenzhenica TaxID=1088818 RepID=A0A2I0AH17_9ASPA|nr:hypothetical protein AXF42_Ash000682 [Apostasia shenzhenica]
MLSINKLMFFLVYLLSHSVSTSIQQGLLLFCEVHFSLLYVLRLNLIATALEKNGSSVMLFLSQLGLSSSATFADLSEIGILLCFAAVQIYGSKVLFSFSAIVQHSPVLPFGFSVLKAGFNKSVLLSIYASLSSTNDQLNSSKEKIIARYLSDVGQFFSRTYHSFGTYVAFLTILINVYLVNPNYISFGYLLFLLLWITGRQLVEETTRKLWCPLNAYAILVFIFTYSLSISTSFQILVSRIINLYPDLGFRSEASMFENIRHPLAILIVMQLYSYERSEKTQSREIYSGSNMGFVGFVRRFLIWHSEKILSAAAFYVSLSSISAVGFVYLVALIVFSAFPKASHFPSKFFLVYTAIIVTLDYSFQLWGELLLMFPGQELYAFSIFLGFTKFDFGFKGIEMGLRGKILVIISCILQYNVFHWLKSIPVSFVYKGQWEEPCHLFLSREKLSIGIYSAEVTTPLVDSTFPTLRQSSATSLSFPSFKSDINRAKDAIVRAIQGSERGKEKKAFGYIGENSRENQKWDVKRMRYLRRERFELQKSAAKVYVKFWFENLFKLRGLEINMTALLLASFLVLNVISIFYILCLLICILLKRDIIRKSWPIFMFSFASILILEYSAIWKSSILLTYSPSEMKVHCHDCWSSSSDYISYCKKCWLGVIVDDPRMLVSYFIVFMSSSFKLRCDHLHRFSDSHLYRQMVFLQKNASVWKDLLFETKYIWTFLDYLRLYTYFHLLDIVLALILITGTLEYDILHFGYLAFALLFFRMRLEILKRKNEIFKYLRMYNFTLIVLSLTYQSPYLGNVGPEKYEKIDYIFEVIGFYKYDYGFRITSRSALVEIVIFLLASMQSYIFNSKDFDNVARYIEAEQIGAVVREEEKKAARKNAQLQHIRMSEELKKHRNLQVEKMKSEMLNLQIQLNRMNSFPHVANESTQHEGLKQRRTFSQSTDKANILPGNDDRISFKQDNIAVTEKPISFDFAPHNIPQDILLSHQTAGLHNLSNRIKDESSSGLNNIEHAVNSIYGSSVPRVTDYSKFQCRTGKEKIKGKVNPLISAAQLIGDGVSQVRSLGNQAVTNIVSFLNISPEDSDSDGYLSAEEGLNDEMDGQTNTNSKDAVPIPSVNPTTEAPAAGPPAASLQIRKIFRFIWAQMRSNNDVVCYCCFVIVFLWNFSLLSMVYLAALFLYALCVNSGPCYYFWVMMLMYTEFNILLQYLYQIIIQHCSLDVNFVVLRRLGFLSHKITTSFVMSTLPLFMVYISTLLQTSITSKDSVWAPIKDSKVLEQRTLYQDHFAFYFHKALASQTISRMSHIKYVIRRSFSRYWRSLTHGSEAPPYFVQLSMKVDEWPEDGIQPERIESRVNQLLAIFHKDRCESKNLFSHHSASKVRIQSIEQSQVNSDIALAVFEVIYASPPLGCKEAEFYHSLTPASDVATEILRAQCAGLFDEVNFPYRITSVIGGGRREVDLYAYIFCADLVVFFLVATFYQSVIENKSRFLDVYQFEDQFPKEFVFILMVLFFLIVLDRVIYLCSFATSKVVYYLFNIVLFTYSVTEYAWYMEPSHHVGGFALRVIYLTKAISLALQALQIRSGIANKSTLYRQFLTSIITRIHFLGFRLYRALPFLYELRCVLDWSCTTTSLTMYDWLKLEDINASLFLVKCDAVLNRACHQQGQRQTKLTKFCSGICLLFILICVIWAPMLMYSSGNPTNIANPIKDVSVHVEIKAAGGRLTLFQTTLCELVDWENPNILGNLDPKHYLDMYNAKDIQLICCQADASTSWLIPPAVQDRFIRSLDIELDIIFSWAFTRERPKGKEVVKYELQVEHPPCSSEVKKVFNGTADGFIIADVYPRYFRVTGSGEVRLLEQTVDSVSGNLLLNHGNPSWWSFHDINALDVKGCKDLTGPMAIVVSEETPQGILGETLSKFSIWSLYLTFVLAVGRFIRLQFSELKMRIPYENLPSCDRLIAICEDIYAARAEGELEVEEVLYWTLVKIYRSPHMLLEYTKPD